jgi:hypothetical protein
MSSAISSMMLYPKAALTAALSVTCRAFLHHEAIVDEIGLEWVFTNGRCVNRPSPGSSAHRRLRVLAAPPQLG